MGESQDLYIKKGKNLIPGGTQLLSKQPEMFLPGLWPAYYEKAKGCEIWDLDGNSYIDMSYMGIGSCILGYADEDVDNAVKMAIDRGSMTTLNCPEEIQLAHRRGRISGGRGVRLQLQQAKANQDRKIPLGGRYGPR